MIEWIKLTQNRLWLTGTWSSECLHRTGCGLQVHDRVNKAYTEQAVAYRYMIERIKLTQNRLWLTGTCTMNKVYEGGAVWRCGHPGPMKSWQFMFGTVHCSLACVLDLLPPPPIPSSLFAKNLIVRSTFLPNLPPIPSSLFAKKLIVRSTFLPPCLQRIW